MNNQIILKSRPVGWVKETDFGQRETALPAPGDGDVLVRSLYMSLDPYMRGRMDDAKSYAQCFQLNEPLKARVIGEVAASENTAFRQGDVVFGMLDWADYSLAPGGRGLRHLPDHADGDLAPLPCYLGILGMPGMTAWIGMEMGAGQNGYAPGETVFVSAASGAVGQIAGQIGKFQGCRVVGSAGTDAKAAFCVEELGFDAAFNYNAGPDYLDALKSHCPDGIDMYFDNVGGEMLEAVLDHANTRARIIVCGMISQYNLGRAEMTGVRNLTHINRKRLRMEGFIVSDHAGRLDEFMQQMGAWMKSGKIKYKLDITKGLGNAPRAFIAMLKGENFGKQVVQISDHAPP